MFRYEAALITCLISLASTGPTRTELPPAGMRVIPEGSFFMGTHASQQPIASPTHLVKLNSCYMDTHEVTNKAYYEFCLAKGHKLPDFWGMDIFKSYNRFTGVSRISKAPL